MTIGYFLALLGVGFGCCAASYRSIAIERGWPYGAFYNSERPIWIGIASVINALVCVGFLIADGAVSWLSFLWIPAAWVVGGGIFINVLKEKTGPAALLLTPVLIILSLLL